VSSIKRFVLAGVSTLVIAASLWGLTSPVAGMSISFPSVPGSGVLGSPYTFTVKVDIQDVDLLPLRSADLRIYNAASPNTYAVVLSDLPLPPGPSQTVNRTYSGSGGVASVVATSGTDWGYASSGIGTRYGYGYSYQAGIWGTQTYPTGYGYGYGSGSHIGPTSITFQVTWTSPLNWPEGTYSASVIVYGNGASTALANGTTPSFVLGYPSSLFFSGVSGITSLFGSTGSFVLDYTGKLVSPVNATSQDGMMNWAIPAGTVVKDRLGNPLTSLTAAVDNNPPPPPANASIIGLTYNFGPEGATFSPPMVCSYSYTLPLPAGVTEDSLVLAYWDAANQAWEEYPSTIDKVNKKVTASISHFSKYSLIGKKAPPTVPTPPPLAPTTPVTLNPAAFTTSGLTIAPDRVKTGESASVTVNVTNNGDLQGTFKVTLLLNGVVEDTDEVTLAGGASQKVTFTVSKAQAGIYAVSIDSHTANLVVETPAPPPPVTPEEPVKPTEPVPWAAIMGGVIGAIVIIALAVLLIRRARKS